MNKPTTPQTLMLPRTKPVSSKHIDGISDLVVACPIKQGFIDAFEPVTYETRLRLAAGGLFNSRQTFREFQLLRPLVDPVERIQSIRSFRIAVVEAPTEARVEKRLVLSVTFDRPWEPYIRLVWKPLGELIDLFFCNCQGYVPAGDTSFEEYVGWLRANQVDAAYFYPTTNLSVTDFQYLVQIDRLFLEKEAAEAEIKAAGMSADNPIVAAEDVRGRAKEKSDEIALETLGGLYRLTSFYPLDRSEREGRFLHRAARGLLDGWKSKEVDPDVRDLFQDWLDWFENDAFSEPRNQNRNPVRPLNRANVQGGILNGYDKRDPDRPIKHGCLLMMQVSDASLGRELVAALKPRISTEASGKGIYLNLAFTHRGLRSLEVPPAELRKFPQEFLEGPEQRAGLLGDVLQNHPRRWRMPRRNWNVGPNPSATVPVELSEIDLVLQLRTHGGDYDGHDVLREDGTLDRKHPLAESVADLARLAERHGARLLSVQSMRSWPVDNDDDASNHSGYVTREHFGFLDGFSNPMVDAGGLPRDRLSRGEVLLGYGNDREDGPPAPSRYLDDGSFLVIRKIAQHVGALRKWVRDEADRLVKAREKESRKAASANQATVGKGAPFSLNEADKPLARQKAVEAVEEQLLTSMMGRTPDGHTRFPNCGSPKPPSNDFSYDDDTTGEYCPLQSHIRRANPRRGEHRRPVPRIVRRGMSYGPRWEEAPKADRGLLFMSYQSSIAEQYELIQRWLNGGNSSGLGSAQSDPLTGVGRLEPRFYRWRDSKGKIHRSQLDWAEDNGKVVNPFVTLEWLLYLFTPSMAAIDRIAQGPQKPEAIELGIGRDTLLELGRRLMKTLQTGEGLLEARVLLKPLSDLPYGASNPRRFLKLVVSVAGAFGRWARELLLGPRPRRFDHLDAAALGWKSVFEDLGAKDPAERAYGPAVWAAIREDYGGIIRVPYGDLVTGRTPIEGGQRPIEKVVLVADKKLVERVFLDPDGCYTVKGYAPRMENSFGNIFLGMDAGTEYDREAAATVAILMAVSEKRAFEVAYRLSNAILDEALKTGDAIRVKLRGAEKAGKLKRKASLDLSNQFITPALADICTYWFGIPDPEQRFVERGTWRRLEFDPSDKPRCPGDYMAPSRYMFYPDANPAMAKFGQQLGKRLRLNVFQMYKEMLADGERPVRSLAAEGGGKPAPIAAKMFDTILGDADDCDEKELTRRLDLLTRNVVGIMMGMLPPVDGNLRGGLNSWLRDKTLWRVQRALLAAEGGAYARAKTALEAPLRQVMQKYPAPDMVWRTAARNHKLGRLKIRKGERLFVGIVSATLQDRAAGGHDVYPIFGGNRRPKDGGPRPRHACPAHRMAMGTLMGILTALLDKGTIEPLTAPLMIDLIDPNGPDGSARP